jgi:hypothetical protein
MIIFFLKALRDVIGVVFIVVIVVVIVTLPSGVSRQHIGG